jgi:hypothetical protein
LFAAATSKLKCAIRSLSIPSGCVSMADRAACSCAARGLRSARAVWRSFGQAGARDRRAHGSRARDGSPRGREEARSLNLPLPRPTVLTYPTVRALRLVADQKRSRVRVRNVATESTWDEACRVIAEGRGGNCSERERGTLDFRDHEVQTCLSRT